MIKQSAQKRRIWIVLALFSAIAAMGNGLHFLPGLGHGCLGTCLPLVACCDSRADDDKEDCSHEASTLHDAAPCLSDVLGAKNCHCPVCHFFSQAKTVPPTIDFEIDYRVADGRISTIRPLLVDRMAAAYSSRAPPSRGG